MRLWSFDPGYLHPVGLLALWREGLLAQKVLSGATRGYQNHPQLLRFRSNSLPQVALSVYLLAVWREGGRRGYAFQFGKIKSFSELEVKIELSRGQLSYEWELFRHKLSLRNPQLLKGLPAAPKPHPLFLLIDGQVASWEKVKILS